MILNKNSKDSLQLKDLPPNKDWGLVEVNSETDLEAAEAELSDNVDPQAKTLLDERLVTNAIDSPEDEWSWSVSEVTSHHNDVRFPDERADTEPITRPTHAQYQSLAPSYAPLLPNSPPPPPGYAHSRTAHVQAPPPLSTTTTGPLARLKQKIRTNINTLGSISDKLRGALTSIATARDGSDHPHKHHQSHHHHQSDHHQQSSDDGAVSISKIRDSLKSALGLPQTLNLGPEAPAFNLAPALPTAE